MRAQFSPSKLGCYQHCPREFYFQYIRKYPRRIRANQSFGSSMHRTLQGIYQAGGFEGLTEEDAQKHLKQAWISAGYSDVEAEAEAKARGEALLGMFREWSLKEGTPILLEKRMTAEFRDILFLGIVDRLDRHDDNSLEVVEYKSSIAPTTIPPSVLQQVVIYQHLITHRLGERPQRLSVHYLGSNQRFTLTPSPDESEEVLERARQTALNIQNDTEFEASPGEHCQWCDYRYACQRGD